MNTNINEKIHENLDAELDMEQLEDVNGGCATAVAAGIVTLTAVYVYYQYQKTHRRK